jgi:hypothetical protein
MGCTNFIQRLLEKREIIYVFSSRQQSLSESNWLELIRAFAVLIKTVFNCRKQSLSEANRLSATKDIHGLY